MTAPTFYYEKKLWSQRSKYVAGIDEVGRGAFAGPVVCAAVVFQKDLKLKNKVIINDSKKLSEKQRLISSNWIIENALSWGVGVGSVSEINRIGLSKTTASGFRRAVANCNQRLHARVEYLLIDAFYIPYIRGLPMPVKKRRKGLKGSKNPKIFDKNAKQLAIVNGDEKSISIAAASIIAKVYRDEIMTSFGKRERYKNFKWHKNKGYGTREHRNAIKRYGLTKHHRKNYGGK